MHLVWIFILAALLLPTGSATAEIRILDSWHENVDDVLREATVLCIEGQKFVYVFGSGTGTAVTLTQIFEERDGQIVPARCNVVPTVLRVPPAAAQR